MKLWQGAALLAIGVVASTALVIQANNYLGTVNTANAQSRQVIKEINSINQLVMNKKAKSSIKTVNLTDLDSRVTDFTTTALNYPVTGKDDNSTAFKQELAKYATSVAVSKITAFRQPTVTLDNQTLPTYKLDSVNRQTVDKNTAKYLVVFAPDKNANQHMVFDLTVDPVSSTVTDVTLYREANTNA
ncbi:hypothetical protein WOSG25_050130 [Weissella oryzae SG25]|uniref:Uncharacterized protein n=1 Tax=Weissella oryzae (strain DSM 25784 / JCM 18191 / LMG 30913 / SG25) TaxID=1329250 RepID=A0A069D096_WEIOS|nr:hypothetical protein [Weissella oryzae]GAK30741.1 hypothetical protein WOSG25_050130 [Weissella oryzae SG25]